MREWGETMGRYDESGLTLIEMLVVLAIIGTIAGATVLGIGAATRGPSVEAEAKRLASNLQLAADEAMVDDQRVAMIWDDKSYAFVRDDRRIVVPRHNLAAGIRMDMGDARQPLPIGIDGSGVPATAGLHGSSDRWLVVYDGLTATTSPMPVA